MCRFLCRCPPLQLDSDSDRQTVNMGRSIDRSIWNMRDVHLVKLRLNIRVRLSSEFEMSDFIGVTAFTVPDLAEAKQQALLFDKIAIPGLSLALNDPSFLDGHLSGEICWLVDQGLFITAAIPVDQREVEELMRVENLFVKQPNYFTR